MTPKLEEENVHKSCIICYQLTHLLCRINFILILFSLFRMLQFTRTMHCVVENEKVVRNFGLKMGRSQERTLHDPFSVPRKSYERIKVRELTSLYIVKV